MCKHIVLICVNILLICVNILLRLPFRAYARKQPPVGGRFSLVLRSVGSYQVIDVSAFVRLLV